MSEMESVLDAVSGHDELIGCALVTRDGLPGPMRFSQPHDAQTLSAMSAAALAAAETALAGLDPDVECMVIQGSATRTVIQGLDARHLIVIIASHAVPVDELIQHANEARDGLKVLHAQ